MHNSIFRSRPSLPNRIATQGLCSLLAVLIATGPLAPAIALAGESAAPAEAFTFADSGPSAKGAADASNRKSAGKERRVPVSSSGSYADSIPIDVPPGRGAMTSSLSLSYDSGSRQQESAVGLGWSFGTPSISRSTREGFPRVTGTSYDDNGAFTSPAGELAKATGTVDGPPSSGSLYAPVRETAPVRYSHIAPPPAGVVDPTQIPPVSSGGGDVGSQPSASGCTDHWIEHDPSGIKRYYGCDPFNALSSAKATITNEFGIHGWLLVREEDQVGNSITYEYHNIQDQNRANKALAQKIPVLKKVSWGQNRLTGVGVQFEVTTTVVPQAGPVDMLHGHTVLTSKVTQISVGAPGFVHWVYNLHYKKSITTERQLLSWVERTGDALPYPTYRRFDFDYTLGGPSFAPWHKIDGFAAAQGVAGPYELALHLASQNNPGENSLEGSIDARGYRSATKFLDYDGNGRIDAIYHGAGLRTPQARILQDLSRAGCDPSAPGAPCFAPASTFPAVRVSELTDLDGDGDADPLAFGESFNFCTIPSDVPGAPNGYLNGLWTNPPSVGAWDPATPTILTNVARTSNVLLPGNIQLPGWPTSAQRAGTVIAHLDSHPVGYSNAWSVQFTPTTMQDFEAPLVDLNGDGRADIALVKSFWNNMGAWTDPGNQQPPQCALLDDIGNMAIWGTIDGGISASNPFPVSGNLRRALANVPRGPASPEVLAYLRRILPLNVANALARVPIFGELSRAQFDTVVGDRIRTMHMKGAGPPPPDPPDPPAGFDPGDLPNPEDNLPKYGPPWFFTGDSLFTGVNDPPAGLGSGGGASEYSAYTYLFTPKVYLAQGASTVSYNEESATGTRFTDSLKHAYGLPTLADWVANLAAWLKQVAWTSGWNGTELVWTGGGTNPLDGAYTTRSGFNSFFMDVNGDSLPDLVLAEPPVDHEGKTTCVAGHRILINRGNRFEARAPGDTTPDLWLDSPWPTETWSNRLDIVRNRGNRCMGGGDTHFADSRGNAVQTLAGVAPMDDSSLDAYGAPMSTLSPVDIDADGRIDLVVAYDLHAVPIIAPHDAPVRVRRVFRNTGRGFQEWTPAQVMAVFPVDFKLSRLFSNTNFQAHRAPAWKATVEPDTGRIVDLDNDGLVDLVRPGVKCWEATVLQQQILGLDCTDVAPTWARNTGSIPDVLIRTTSSLGSETSIEYGSALGANVTLPAGGIRPSASTQVVTKITHRSVPQGSVVAGAPPDPVTMLSYSNFVRDPVSREALGFERVTAQFLNAVPGQALETATQTQRFDVQPLIAGIPLRHPLKGALVETITTSSDLPGERTRTVSSYAVTPFGGGVRIRQAASFSEQCAGGVNAQGACVGLSAISGTETTAWDPMGYPSTTHSGDSNGQHVTGELTTSAHQYEHHKDATWILGLPKDDQLLGKRVALDGTATNNAVLSEVQRTFDPATGLTLTVRRPSFQAPGCEAAGTDDTVTLAYDTDGLPKQITTARGQVEKTFYAADRLYVDHKQAIVGATTFLSKFDFDRRTGAATFVQDLNGNKEYLQTDSFGRLRLHTRVPVGGAAQVIGSVTYHDVALPVVDTTSHSAQGKSALSRTHFDGDGRSLGTVELADGVALRTEFQQYDAFRRVVSAALPSYASGIDDYEVQADPRRVRTETDGFDRLTKITNADTTFSTSQYAPRVTYVTNPRGYKTERQVDWRGNVVSVKRYGDNNVVVLSSHTVSYDGAGRVVQVNDADGTVRRVEYDAGGRKRKVEFPHVNAPSVPIKHYEYCHDVEDAIASSLSPEGRAVSVIRDTAGRPLFSQATLGNTTVQGTLSYDDPAATNGIGRLTKTVDDSGTSLLQYDAFGRLRQIDRALPQGLVSGPQSYTSIFDYDYAGDLNSFTVKSPTKTLASVSYTRDSRGRATTVTSSTSTVVDGIVFDENHHVTSAHFGNDVTGAWGFDPLTSRLNSIEYRQGVAPPFATVLYPIYDKNGNLETESRYDGIGLISQKIHTYSPLDRLASSDLSHLVNGNSQESFLYSAAGNMATAGADVYTYARGDYPQAVTHLVGASGNRDLGYSADGLVTSDIQALEQRNLTWNAAGCLTGIVSQPDGRTTSLLCDSAGATFYRKTTGGGEPDNTRLDLPGVGEIRPEQGILLLRIPVNGTAAVEEARSLADGSRIDSLSGYLLSDARESVLAKTAYLPGGTPVVEAAEYDAWGATKQVANPLQNVSFPAPVHQFTGVEPDPGLGLYHFGVRTYDPTLRRWLSPDPLLLIAPDNDVALGDNLNLYQYAANNPVGRVDPDGRFPFLAIAGAVAFIAYVGTTVQHSDDVAGHFKVAVGAAGGSVGAAVATKVVGAGGSLVLRGAVSGALGGSIASVGARGVDDAARGKLSPFSAYVGDAVGGAAVGALVGGSLGRLQEGFGSKTGKGVFDALCAGEGCGGPGVCFVAGTRVATESGEVPIETLGIGDRVLADNPACEADHIDPFSVSIRLTLPNPKAPADQVAIEMVRPREWWSEQTPAPSGQVWIDLPEIELSGWATVERVTAAPQEIAGRGCLVLMTVSHVGSEILKLTFAETDETVELTPVHRLFSEERGWVQARLLTVGERLRSGSGGVTVASISEAIPNRRVYNLEVGREHSFMVLRSQIWAHNTDYVSGAGKTFQTYTKGNPTTGEVYSGRASGTGTPEQNLARRDAGHHMTDQGFGPAQLDKSSGNKAAIRGREQQLIEANGGAKSGGGTSGNAINGISPSNPKGAGYIKAANKEFGE